MKNATHIPRRSCFDRRSTNDRRGRWWNFFKKSNKSENHRTDHERRKLPEKRCDWERISKWSSAPKVHKYRYPYIHDLSGTREYPYW